MPRDSLANPMVLAALGALLERPMHTYQLTSMLRERGVPVNRGSIYNTVEAMERAGWITPGSPEQTGGRPARTPFALTVAGRQELIRRLDQQIRTPGQEFSEFLGAVSHIGVLGPRGAAEALRERAEKLSALIAEDEERLARAPVPQLFVIEAEYAIHMTRAERSWILGAIDQIETGQLAWPLDWPLDCSGGSDE